MAQQMSNYFVQLIEDQWFGKTATPTIPSNWYVCMYTVTPGLGDSGGTEATGNGYVRLVIPNTSAYFSAAVSRQKNAAGVSYPLSWFTASGTIGPVVATAIRDASSAGNLIMLYDVAPGSQQTINSGNVITFNAADFSWRID